MQRMTRLTTRDAAEHWHFGSFTQALVVPRAMSKDWIIMFEDVDRDHHIMKNARGEDRSFASLDTAARVLAEIGVSEFVVELK